MNVQLQVTEENGRVVIAGVGVTLQLVTTAPPPVDPPPPPPVDPPPPPPPVDPPTPGTITRGVILDRAELMALKTEGAAYDALHSSAQKQTITGAKLSDMHMQHDVGTLSVTLDGVRLDDPAMIAKGHACLENAIGTEAGGDWMDVGRSLAAYIIAADTLNIRSGPIFEWLAGFRTRLIPHDNTGKPMTLRERAWETGTNASCQVGLCSTAMAVYLRDADWLRDNWDAFRRYCGDKTSPFILKPNQFGDPWQMDLSTTGRVGIQPKGAVKNGLNIDGANVDMGRSNPSPKPSLSYDARNSLYPWVSLNGAIWAALILHRQGYPAFEIQDRAILRAVQFMRRLAKDYNQMGWWGQDKKEDVKWLAHVAYPNDLPLVEYPITLPVGPHDQVGWSDWTHPTGI